MGLERPLAQNGAHKKKSAVIATRVPLGNYEVIRERAVSQGFGSMGDYLRSLAYADCGIKVEGSSGS